MTKQQAVVQGKQDEHNKLVGGFAVAAMSTGGYDWFPVGQPPNVNGEPDRGARITEKWAWNGYQWRQIA